MKRFFLLTLALAGSLAWAARPVGTAADHTSHETNAFTPDTIPWGPAPPVVRRARSSRCSKATPPLPPATSPFV